MKKFLAILFSVVAVFLSACFFVGCEKNETPGQSQTQTPGGSGGLEEDSGGEGNTNGSNPIIPDGEGIQMPIIP